MRWSVCERPSGGRPTTSTRRLATTIGASRLTLGGLLKHLAACEDFVSTVKLTGDPIGDPWAANGWDADDDWEFTSAAHGHSRALYALYDGAVDRNRARVVAALAAGGLDAPVHAASDEGEHASLRRLVCDHDRGVRTAHRPRRPPA